jgi:hypothetical protein
MSASTLRRPYRKSRKLLAWLRLELIVVVHRPKESLRGARKEKWEKWNGCEGGKRWNLIELSCARARDVTHVRL